MPGKRKVDEQNPRLAPLRLLRWSTRRLAMALGEHPVTVGRFLNGGAELPGVATWLDLISTPLRQWPGPHALCPRGPDPAMLGAELRAMREAMRWSKHDLGAFLGRTDVAVSRMEQSRAPVDDAVARWTRKVTGPIRVHPLPDGWEPRYAFVPPAAPGQPALPRALPDNVRRREQDARTMAKLGVKQERDAKRAEQGRLRREHEERRRAAREESGRLTHRERLRLGAERARRAAELDDGQRTVEEIGWELGISHQAVTRLRRRRRAETGNRDRPTGTSSTL